MYQSLFRHIPLSPSLCSTSPTRSRELCRLTYDRKTSCSLCGPLPPPPHPHISHQHHMSPHISPTPHPHTSHHSTSHPHPSHQHRNTPKLTSLPIRLTTCRDVGGQPPSPFSLTSSHGRPQPDKAGSRPLPRPTGSQRPACIGTQPDSRPPPARSQPTDALTPCCGSKRLTDADIDAQ